VATKAVENFGSGEIKDVSSAESLHEATLLMLDISKAKFKLGWEPRMNLDQTIEMTIDWYKKYKTQHTYELCVDQIKKYFSL
jgi:CDP-glucose 4,6-dehydratase